MKIGGWAKTRNEYGKMNWINTRANKDILLRRNFNPGSKYNYWFFVSVNELKRVKGGWAHKRELMQSGLFKDHDRAYKWAIKYMKKHPYG